MLTMRQPKPFVAADAARTVARVSGSLQHAGLSGRARWIVQSPIRRGTTQ